MCLRLPIRLEQDIDSGTYTLTWYARTNTVSEGATIVGVAESDGWRITVPSSTRQTILTRAFGLGRPLQPTDHYSTRLVVDSLRSKRHWDTQETLLRLMIARELKSTLKKLRRQYGPLPKAE